MTTLNEAQYIKQQTALHELYIRELDNDRKRELAIQMMALQAHYKMNLPVEREQEVRLPDSQVPPLKINTSADISPSAKLVTSIAKITPENFDKCVKASAPEDQKILDALKNDPKAFAKLINALNLVAEAQEKEAAKKAGFDIKKTADNDKSMSFELTKKGGAPMEPRDLASYMHHAGVSPKAADINKIKEEVDQMQKHQKDAHHTASMSGEAATDFKQSLKSMRKEDSKEIERPPPPTKPTH